MSGGLRVLPRWLPTWRGAAVLAVGLLCIGRGLSYLDSPLPGSLTFVSTWVPAPALAVLWFAVGVYCLADLLHRRWSLSMALAAGVHGGWAIAALAAQAFLDVPRAYVAALSYAAFAVLIAAVANLRDRPRVSVVEEESGS